MKSSFKSAFPQTLPVLAGYVSLGIAFGILLRDAGYGVFYAFLMSLFVFAGSAQFLCVELIMSVLLVYCLKSVEFTAAEKCIPQLISVAVVILLHIWKRNTLLRIGFGTLLYMILFQFVF